MRYKAGGRDLGIRAVEHAGEDLAGDHDRFPLRGRVTREGDGSARWGPGGSGGDALCGREASGGLAWALGAGRWARGAVRERATRCGERAFARARAGPRAG